MANTITVKDLTIEIKGDGGAIDADWTFSDDIDDTGLYISSIQFTPHATADKCVIKEGGATGPVIFEALCADVYDQKIKYFHGERKHPFLDVSDGVYGGVNAKIIIELSEISG